MDKLTNKQSYTYDYISRYAGVANYFDTEKNKEVPGVINQMNFTTDYVLHKIKDGDTLDKLALKYYNNPTYWWAIAHFNKITDAFKPLTTEMTTIKIPTISSLLYEVK